MKTKEERLKEEFNNCKSAFEEMKKSAFNPEIKDTLDEFFLTGEKFLRRFEERSWKYNEWDYTTTALKALYSIKLDAMKKDYEVCDYDFEVTNDYDIIEIYENIISKTKEFIRAARNFELAICSSVFFHKREIINILLEAQAEFEVNPDLKEINLTLNDDPKTPDTIGDERFHYCSPKGARLLEELMEETYPEFDELLGRHNNLITVTTLD